VKDGHYMYMDHLNLLDSQRPKLELHPETPIVSQVVHTLLCLRQWAVELSDHPDPAFATYILSGIYKGFCIGFDRQLCLKSSLKNLNCDNPSKVTEYLAREVALHRMWKYLVDALVKGVHLSSLGLTSKNNKLGKWRMIVDLSPPEHSSINEVIRTELSSLQYTSIDDLAAPVGKSPFLVKADVKEAYRMIPVHPWVKWNGVIYLDEVLPFGLRSAPKVVADAILWILNKKGIVAGLHYLDDFIMNHDSGFIIGIAQVFLQKL